MVECLRMYKERQWLSKIYKLDSKMYFECPRDRCLFQIANQRDILRDRKGCLLFLIFLVLRKERHLYDLLRSTFWIC